jgi:hypothetical protein
MDKKSALGSISLISVNDWKEAIFLGIDPAVHALHQGFSMQRTGSLIQSRSYATNDGWKTYLNLKLETDL